MYYKYALSCYFHSYELHISLSCRKRGKTSLLPRLESTNITYIERLESVIKWNLWVLFWKLIKNSGTIVEQRPWDIVLDLIVLSFNCSRPKWRLRSPVEGNMGKFQSQNSLFSSRGEFLFERMCTFEKWKHRRNCGSITEFSIAQGQAKVKLGEVIDSS